MKSSKQKYPFVLLLICFVLLLTLFTTSLVYGATFTPDATSVSAQTDLTPTPTMTPLLQSDLQVITGNILRPNGIYWHEGSLWVTCAGDSTIYKVNDTTGETVTYIAGVLNAHTLFVESQEGSPEPAIWLPDFQRNAFVQVGGSPRTLDVIAENLASPWGVVVTESDSFYITQLRADDVVEITRDGDVRAIAGGFRNPTGIALDGEYVYVANNGSARRAIEWFEITAEQSTPLQEEDLKPLVSGLQSPTSLVMGPDKLLYFAYSLGARGIIGRVDPAACREKNGCTNVDVEIVLWSELAAPLAGLVITPDMRLFIHTMFGAEVYWTQLPSEADMLSATLE